MDPERLVTQPDEQLVMAYLANRLSETEAAAFELYCLEHPEFAREVERELALKMGFREWNANQLRGPRSRWVPVAMAATVLLAVIAGLWRYSAFTPGHENLLVWTSAAELPATLRGRGMAHATLIRLRQSEEPVLAAGLGVLEIRVVPDAPAGPQGYTAHIEVRSPAASTATTVRIKQVESDGAVGLYFSSAQLVGKRLSVSIWPTDHPTVTQTFQAQIVEGDARSP